MTYDCIILGGGISGLGAGKTLIQKGITNFLILEGRERIGGRIHSQDMQGGFYAELGAERIGKTHKNLIKIIKMQGNAMKCNEMQGNAMKLIDHTFLFHSHLHVSNVSGVTKSVYHMHEEKLNNFLNSFHSRKDEKIKKYDNYTLEALLIELGIDIMGLEDLELENSNEFGETMKMLSASRFIINCLTGGGNCHCDYKVEQGNSKIIDKLISFIGKEKISTNKNITNICMQKDHYIITCKDGSIFKTQYILSTIPLYAYHYINRNGLLDKKKLAMIHEIPYGRILKCGFVIERRTLINNDFGILSDSVLHTIYNTGKGIDGGGKNLIGIYSTGEKGFLLSKKSNQEIFEELQKINEFNSVKKYDGYYRYYRGEDSYTKGAFAIVPPKLCYSLPKIFNKKDGNIYYSGEHCSLAFQGFMEGALETGIKQAQKIAKKILK